jgi:regulator of sigma E protease
MVGFISFVVVFSLLIFAHELGHFAAAKLCGVRVDEFGFGYPPRLIKLGQWRETTISLNALPIGGFVRMSEDDPSVEGSLASKGRATRFLVLVAGSLMNVVLALVLFSVTFMMGTPTPFEGPGAGVYYVAPQSPANQAGLRAGDTIVSIAGQEILQVEQAVEVIKAHLGQPIHIVVRRDGKELPPMEVTPRVNPPANEGALGVALDLPLATKSYPIWQAVPMGIRTTFNAVRAMYEGILGVIFGRQEPFQVTGPIGIYSMTREAAKTGLSRLVEFTAFLSLNLFLVNLLPLPALDGGRVIFVILEWVRGGRKIAPEKEGAVHAIGMLLLIGLMVAITVMDYMRYFG